MEIRYTIKEFESFKSLETKRYTTLSPHNVHYVRSAGPNVYACTSHSGGIYFMINGTRSCVGRFANIMNEEERSLFFEELKENTHLIKEFKVE